MSSSMGIKPSIWERERIHQHWESFIRNKSRAIISRQLHTEIGKWKIILARPDKERISFKGFKTKQRAKAFLRDL